MPNDASKQGTNSTNKKAWDADEAMAAMVDERDLFDDTPESQAKRLIQEGTAIATASLLYIAQYGDKDSDRIRASMVILDRAWGPGAVNGGGAKDPLEAALGKFVKELEDMANTVPATAREIQDRRAKAIESGPLDHFIPEPEDDGQAL